MKILLTTFWCLPHVGGVWTYMQGLYRHLLDMGHEVDLLAHTPDSKQFYKLNRDEYVDKSRFESLVREHVHAYYNRHLPELDKWMRNRETDRYTFELGAACLGVEGYDLIHTQDVISTRAIARIKPKRTPLLATIHGSLPHEDILRGAVSRGTLPWHYTVAQEHLGTVSSDHTLVPSQWLKDIMVRDIFVPPDHMTVLPYGMDIDAFLQKTETPLALDIPSGKTILLCPARLDRIKGQESLLDALALLKRDRSDWVCWLAGDGYMREKLEQQAKRLGLEPHVVFLGARKDVPALLKAADIFVLPSLQDNQPFVVMEAQIMGKAVVSTDAGGIPEMVSHEHTGLLSPRGESEPMYRNLKRLLDEPGLRNRLGHHAEVWGREYWSLGNMIDSTLAIYEKFVPGIRN